MRTRLVDWREPVGAYAPTVVRLDGTSYEDAAARASMRLEGKSPEHVLTWATERIPRFVVTSSFGAESAVLLHMVHRVAPQTPVVFLDTDFHFPETLDYRRDLAEQLGLRVIDVKAALTPEEQASQFGDALYQRDPDACCRLRKITPLRRVLTRFDGWATGVRRSQTQERVGTPIIEARWRHDRWLFKVAPLATWEDDDVLAYQRRHDLPQHPLVAAGYRSIGCAPCTRPVSEGDSPRAGRWSAFEKTECGLHLPGDAPIDSVDTPG